jgi:hypothetical protein
LTGMYPRRLRDARSKTDPDAKVARKGTDKEAKLSYNGNLMVENRSGLIVNTRVFEANGRAERDTALVTLEQISGTKQLTVGSDKTDETAHFVAECRNLKVTPHVAQNVERGPVAERSMPHDAARRLCHLSEEEETHWRVLRMAEDDRFVAEGSALWKLQGWVDLYLRSNRL